MADGTDFTTLDAARSAYDFNGQYRHAIDTKGRLSIPASLRRDQNGNEIGRFKLTAGFDDCLFAFPYPYWAAVVVPQLMELPVTQDEARRLVRRLLSGAADCVPDRQGRILIPAPLRARAALDSDAIIIGVLSRLEIWNVERWLAYDREGEAAFEVAAERYTIKF